MQPMAAVHHPRAQDRPDQGRRLVDEQRNRQTKQHRQQRRGHQTLTE